MKPSEMQPVTVGVGRVSRHVWPSASPVYMSTLRLLVIPSESGDSAEPSSWLTLTPLWV